LPLSVPTFTAAVTVVAAPKRAAARERCMVGVVWVRVRVPCGFVEEVVVKRVKL
jgi:hypothetical protein